jgi:hypothetical protein
MTVLANRSSTSPRQPAPPWAALNQWHRWLLRLLVSEKAVSRFHLAQELVSLPSKVVDLVTMNPDQLPGTAQLGLKSGQLHENWVALTVSGVAVFLVVNRVAVSGSAFP